MGPHRSVVCEYGQRQIVSHVVDTCPVTEFEGRLYVVGLWLRMAISLSGFGAVILLVSHRRTVMYVS